MKLFKYVLPFVLATVGFTSKASAICSAESAVCPQGHEYSTFSKINERDYEDVINYVKTKRMIPLKDKSCDLMLSGDIRAGWANFKEKHNGVRRRGDGANQGIDNPSGTEENPATVFGPRIPQDEFDIEFNLWLDYKGSCTWAVTHFIFANEAGIDINRFGCCGSFVDGCSANESTYASGHTKGDPNGGQGSGFCNNICLYRAYFGYNIFEECNSRLDIEIGRRPLWDIFESDVQFRSRFDGVLLRYSNQFDCIGDFYVNVGGFLIDENSHHFGWVGETGLLDICDYGFDVKYSFINWRRNNTNRCDVKDPWGMKFAISQIYAAYHFDPEWLCAKAKIYAAVLMNHQAKRRVETHHKKKQYAWYAGFMVGDVRREGDWYVDFNYQYVEAQSIPDFDVSGIGRGNVKGIPFTMDQSWGNVNYYGFRLEGLYALTDNLGINPSYEWSRHQDSAIGGKNNFGKFELQFIYAF